MPKRQLNMQISKNLKKIIFIAWIFFIVISISSYFLFPDFFEKENILFFFNKYKITFLIIYSLASILRGLTLVPSTPFILVGTIIFPQHLIFVFTVSIIGILISSTIIYYFSDFMNFKEVIERKYSKKIRFIEEKLNTKFGFLFVIFWSFFPLVPTDLICYVAGTIKLDFKKYILAIFLGEFPLVFIYIYGLNNLISFFIN